MISVHIIGRHSWAVWSAHSHKRMLRHPDLGSTIIRCGLRYREREREREAEDYCMYTQSVPMFRWDITLYTMHVYVYTSLNLIYVCTTVLDKISEIRGTDLVILKKIQCIYSSILPFHSTLLFSLFNFLTSY